MIVADGVHTREDPLQNSLAIPPSPPLSGGPKSRCWVHASGLGLCSLQHNQIASGGVNAPGSGSIGLNKVGVNTL